MLCYQIDTWHIINIIPSLVIKSIGVVVGSLDWSFQQLWSKWSFNHSSVLMHFRPRWWIKKDPLDSKRTISVHRGSSRLKKWLPKKNTLQKCVKSLIFTSNALGFASTKAFIEHARYRRWDLSKKIDFYLNCWILWKHYYKVATWCTRHVLPHFKSLYGYHTRL